MKLENMSTSLLLLWSLAYIHTSTGSAGASLSDLSKISSKMSVDILTAQQTPLHIKPEVTVDVRVGSTADLQCDATSEGLVKWWRTPFGSFRDGPFRDNDPININNGTLRILRATSSHIGLYHCQLVDSSSTTVIPYRVNVVDKNKHETRLRVARDARMTGEHELAAGVVPAVLVSFVVAFTLGAFSRPYVIKCLQKTRAKMWQKRRCHTQRIGGIGLFRTTTNKTASVFGDSGASKASTPIKPPSKWFWSKKENQDDGVEEIEIEDEAQNTPEAEEQGEGPCIQHKRRSRVIKVYNYDEEGKRYDHLTEPEVVMIEEEEIEPKPRHRVMSLTRLSTIMSQVQTPDFSASRKSRDNSAAKPDNPPQA